MNNSTDILGGLPLVSCPPYDLPANGTMPNLPPSEIGLFNPTISLAYFMHTLVAYVFFLLVILKYSHVRVFGRRISTNYISNRNWMWYFLFVAVYSAVDGTRYALNLPYYPRVELPDPDPALNYNYQFYQRYRTVDSALLVCTSILRAFAALFLSFALRAQLTYRSGQVHFKDTVSSRYYSPTLLSDEIEDDEHTETSSGDAESDALMPSYTHSLLNRRDAHRSWFAKMFYERRVDAKVLRYDRVASWIFVSNMLALYLNITPIAIGSTFFFYAYAVTFAFLQVPVLILTVIILFGNSSPSSSSYTHILQLSTTGQSRAVEGPTFYSKVMLLVGVVLNLAVMLPPSLESLVLEYLGASDELMGTKCFPLFKEPAFSFSDILTALSILSTIFIFVFVRREFRRVKAKTIWWTVRTVTGTFGFASVGQQQQSPLEDLD